MRGQVTRFSLVPPPFLVSMVVGDSTKVEDVSKPLDVLWKVPPTRLLRVIQTTTPKTMAKIVFKMQNQAIAPTNQVSVWTACEIELVVVYTYARLSVAMNRSKELAISGITT